VSPGRRERRRQTEGRDPEFALPVFAFRSSLMARSPTKFTLGRKALPIAVVLLLVLGLTPVRFIGWIGWFGTLTSTLIAPISQPFTALSRWLAPGKTATLDAPVVNALKEEIENWRTQFLRQQQENIKLQAIMEELYRLKSLNLDVPVRQVTAPVISASSDLSSGLLRVRAGEQHGVDLNTVAVASGLQLLGRVKSTSSRQCLVQPITSRSAGAIRGRVMMENPETRLLCQLEPVGNGTLRGPVFRPERSSVGDAAAPDTAALDAAAPEPAVGQTVRLDDDADRWPRHAQLLIIGKIERVDPNPDMPLRKIITVRPLLALDRVSEVVLRIAEEAAELREENSRAGKPGGEGKP